MPESSQEVLHCPSCGALAPVESGGEDERRCGECGYDFGHSVRLTPREVGLASRATSTFIQRDVSSRRRAAERVEVVINTEARASATVVEAETEEGGDGKRQDEVISDDGRKKVVRRRKKRRRTRMTPLLFLCGWAVVVMVMLIFLKNEGKELATDEEEARELEEQKLRIKQEQISMYLIEQFPECRHALDGFLAAKTAIARTQFVRDPNRLAPVMAAYYGANLPWSLPEGAQVALKRMDVYLGGGPTVIETIWKINDKSEHEEDREERTEPEKKEGSEVSKPGKDEELTGSREGYPDREVAFAKQGGRWVLEWKAFVRYGTGLWDRFLSGSGASEGIFRVYMQIGKDTDLAGPATFTVRFLPARSDGLRWTQKSEWVSVPLNSENGRRIESIMAQDKKKWELGNSIFGQSDPKDLHRVRVALRWATGEGDRKYLQLSEVQAGNWYGEGIGGDFTDPEEEKADGAEPGEEKDGGQKGEDAPGKDSPGKDTPNEEGSSARIKEKAAPFGEKNG